jgi:adenine deaminase
MFDAREPVPPVGLASMKRKPVTPEVFVCKPKPGANTTPVIGVKAGLLLTSRESATLPITANGLAPDPEKDVLKVAVLERHGRTGDIGVGFARGFGFKHGAIASSVGHDSHNIAVVGATDGDMAVAVNRVIAMGGGFVVADGGAVVAELALPIAGLISLETFETVSHQLEHLLAAARGLGCSLPEPFIQVAFLALPVIPHLKMTPRGLFDVDRFQFED